MPNPLDLQPDQQNQELVSDLPPIESVERIPRDQIYLAIPPVLIPQLEDPAHGALKEIFEELLDTMVETARQKAAARSRGVSPLRIQAKEIYEAKEAVWQRLREPEPGFWPRFFTEAEHAGWIAIGFIVERGLTEIKNPSDFASTIAYFVIAAAFIYVIRIFKSFTR